MSLSVPRQPAGSSRGGQFASYHLKSGSRYFITPKELEETTDRLVNIALENAVDSTISAMKGSIPVRSGFLLSQFIAYLVKAANDFKETRMFEIDLRTMIPQYAQYQVKDLWKWGDSIVQHFDNEFDIQLSLFGMAAS